MQSTELARILSEIQSDVKSVDIFIFESLITGLSTELEEIIFRRFQGNFRPIVLFGFDSPVRVRNGEDGFILEISGVYYLKLPATVFEIQRLFDEAAKFEFILEDTINNKSIRNYAIKKIRIFKHTCDNVWMSMSANANRAKKAFENFPENMPAALSEFKSDRIERLLEDYRKLEPIASRLRIAGVDKITKILIETIKMIGKINKNVVSPRKSVDLAFRCVVKIQRISDILSKVKELNKSG